MQVMYSDMHNIFGTSEQKTIGHVYTLSVFSGDI